MQPLLEAGGLGKGEDEAGYRSDSCKLSHRHCEEPHQSVNGRRAPGWSKLSWFEETLTLRNKHYRKEEESKGCCCLLYCKPQEEFKNTSTRFICF